VSGALSLEEGARLAALRVGLLAKLAGNGALVAVRLSAAEAGERIDRFGGEVTIAAVNGPASVLLACAEQHLQELLDGLDADGGPGKVTSRVAAPHPHYVEPVREEMMELFAELEPRDAKPTFYSTVTAEPIATSELDAGYWYRNLRQPVRLHEALQALLRDGF